MSARLRRIQLPIVAPAAWLFTLLLVSPHPPLQAATVQTPWQTNAYGTLSTNISWNYARGYHFTPLVSGQVTALGGYFNGTKTVKLFNKSTGMLLASATVSAANTWSYTAISPVNVTAGTTYTVAVYLAGSGASYRSSLSPALPQTFGNIRIEGSTYASTGTDPTARPTNTVTTTMYGQADIQFLPTITDTTPPSAPPSVIDDGALTTSTTQLHVRWTAASDPESGITGYEYRLYEQLGLLPGTVIIDWTPVGLVTELTRTGLNLVLGRRYFVTVRAKNGAGLYSAATASDGIDVLSPTEVNVTAESRGAYAQQYSGQYGLARFLRFGVEFYNKTGGGGGGRGFNVAVVDQTTGLWIDTGRNFDTWGTRATGTAMNAMLSYLSSIPNGRIVMVAVADDAGLNQYNTCTKFTYTWVESGVQALEALGSQQIRNYCFRGSWALVAVKGQSARAEQLVNAVTFGAAPSMATATIPLQGADTSQPTAPGQPTEGSPDADYDNDGAYTVFWSAASDPESGIAAYELQERIGTAGTWATLSSTITATNFAVSGRAHNTTYYYQVRAKNGAGLWGAFSPTSDGMTVDLQAPQLSLIGVTSITGNSAIITWTTDEPSTSEVDYGLTTSYGSTITLPTLVTTHSVTVNGLLGLSSYRFRVRSTDAAINTAQSGDQTFQTNSPGPSIVSVSGRQLLVQKRNLDGTLAAAVPYAIRGVTWSPASRDTNTWPTDPNNANVRRLEFGRWYQQPTELQAMKAMNVTTARTFMDPGLDSTGRAVLDELYRNGIMVILTVDDASNNKTRIQQAVNFYKDHPAVLMWLLGNEWNINCYYRVPIGSCTGSALTTAAQDTQSAAQLIKTLDTSHPVATSYGDIDGNLPGFVSTTCPTVDVWGLNVYRPIGEAFRTLFTQWASITPKPMFLGEFGVDAFDVRISPSPGAVNESAQAQWDLSLWNDVVRNLSSRDATKVALGGTVFEWNDEWWKISPDNSQQTGGWSSAGFPDGIGNEEYFGIVDINRVKRQVYTTLTSAFDPTYVPPPITVTFQAFSAGYGLSGGWTGAVQFSKDGSGFYFKTGGAGGGRGFNVAVIDATTGTVLDAGRNFDTWAGGGLAKDALVSYLNSIPTGRLVLIAVADEAGLTPGFSCSQYTDTSTTNLLSTLVGLGSTKIRTYCFRSSWAMITVKGSGSARDEQLSSSTAVTAQTALSVP